MTHRLYHTWTLSWFLFLFLFCIAFCLFVCLFIFLFFSLFWAPNLVPVSIIDQAVCRLLPEWYVILFFTFIVTDSSKMLVYCIKNCSPKKYMYTVNMVSQGWRWGSFIPRPHSRKLCFSSPTQLGTRREEEEKESGCSLKFVIPPFWAGISTRVLLWPLYIRTWKLWL